MLIELQNVSYHAKGLKLLDEVSWSLGEGEFWAILGPNGAGKTLMLRMVAGKLWPNAGGTILRQGQELVDLRKLSRRIGWVSTRIVSDIPYNEPALKTVVSGRFAQFGLKPVAWDKPTEQDYEAARAALENLDCGNLAEKTFGVLSQGEQQNVLLARSLIIDPLAIVLDEPCSGLDPSSRELFLDTLRSLLQKPNAPAVVMVTHHMEEIVPEIKRVLVIHQGRVIEEGNMQKVLTPSTLGTIYGREPKELLERDGRYWPIW